MGTKVKRVKWRSDRRHAAVQRFLERPAFDEQAEVAAREVLAEIVARGDAAVMEYAQRFDGTTFARAGAMRVTDDEIKAAGRLVDPAFKRAARATRGRVQAFAKASLKRNWEMATAGGGSLGERFVPLERVGVYVPGGKAPLASTALMTAPLAVVAGVPEIVGCTPCGPDGTVNPYLLYAMNLAGCTEIYRVGGIQAIGMMAYGTRSVPKVLKIVGPGGTYVTAAKRQVYGHVALDLVAGPSEIAVLADDSADPRFVAADLISQAEHGTGHEKVLLVTTSATLADAVEREMVEQSSRLSRDEAIRRVMREGMLIAVVESVGEGMELCNRFAPEHFELLVRQPKRWLRKATCAGAVFVGPWTPEPVGDFAAGPSHVLPTGGAAAMFSGLTVDDFLRRTSFMAYTKRDLREALPIVEAFGRVEGLDGHAYSARVRFEKESP